MSEMSLWLYCVVCVGSVFVGSETPKTGFLMTRSISLHNSSVCLLQEDDPGSSFDPESVQELLLSEEIQEEPGRGRRHSEPVPQLQGARKIEEGRQ